MSPRVAPARSGSNGGVAVGFVDRHHCAELRNQVVDLLAGLAFDRLGHHRGRRLADGAPLAVDGDIGDDTVGDEYLEGELVAAHRVHTLGGGGGGVEVAAVTGIPVVVEDYLAVQLFETHQRRLSTWFRIF